MANPMGLTGCRQFQDIFCNHELQFFGHFLNVVVDDHALIIYLSLLVRILNQLDSFDYMYTPSDTSLANTVILSQLRFNVPTHFLSNIGIHPTFANTVDIGT